MHGVITATIMKTCLSMTATYLKSMLRQAHVKDIAWSMTATYMKCSQRHEHSKNITFASHTCMYACGDDSHTNKIKALSATYKKSWQRQAK